MNAYNRIVLRFGVFGLFLFLLLIMRIQPVLAQTCDTGGSPDAACVGGNISSLNFGFTQYPWFQGYGGDMRLDNGFIDRMSVASQYADEQASGNTGGIVFTGDHDGDPGGGTLARSLFVVGGNSKPEIYSSSRNILRASYTYESALAQQNGTTPQSFSVSCTNAASPCVPTTAMPSHGIYTDISGNPIYFGAAAFSSAAGNYVILIKGDLYLTGKITVAPGSTFTVFVQGDIHVKSNVGEAVNSSTASDIEGFYSTEKKFIIESLANCATSTPDLRLNIAGAVVVNATLAGGTVQNNRTLCASDQTYPSYSIAERPDFILNAPLFIQSTNMQIQEVAQ